MINSASANMVEQLLSAGNLPKLTQQYPWCQVYQSTLALQHRRNGSSQYDMQLNQAAIRIADRTVLHGVVHINKSLKVELKEQVNPPAVETVAEPVIDAPVIEKQVYESPEIRSSTPTQEVVKEPISPEPSPLEASNTEILEEESYLETVNETAVSEEESLIIEENTPDEEEEAPVPEEPQALAEKEPSIAQPQSFSQWLEIMGTPAAKEIAVKEDSVEETETSPKPSKATRIEEPIDELDKIIRTSSPYELFGLQQDLSKNQADQVNSFIDRQIERRQHKASPVKEPKATAAPLPGDELITETLARLYWRQNKKEKAIAAFKKLALKFPEKSTYFASQIEQISKEKLT